VSTSGSTTTTTTYYYYGGGKLLAEAVNGAFSSLATTAQGSVAVALNSSGSATASQLYAPYGATRYASGTMPTDYGYTSQRAESLSAWHRSKRTLAPGAGSGWLIVPTARGSATALRAGEPRRR
jgi:hypothetical protein